MTANPIMETRKVIERNAEGEYALTAYGEFLSYFHTHIQLFGTLVSQKKISPKEQEALKNKIRSYIVNNVQKTDHFFDQLPQFAQFLEISTQDLSAYMNRNFLGALNKVKAKLIEQEVAVDKSPKKKRYGRITDEIIEGLGFLLPKGFRFEQQEEILYLIDGSTGKKVESAGSAEAIRDGAKVAATVTKAPPVPVRRGPETPILQEILSKYGDLFVGTPIVLKKEELEEDDIPIQVNANEILSEVDDLKFEGGFAFDSDDDMPATPLEQPVVIAFSRYMDQVSKVRAFQKAGQLEEYKRWVSTLPSEENALVQLQSSLLKESKGEVVDWDGIISQLTGRTGLSDHRLRKVLELGRDFFRIRNQLESSWNRAKTASPAVSDLVKKAWPHILRVMDEYPEMGQLKAKMDQLLSRIPDVSQRKILSDLFFSPVLSIRKN